MKKLLSVLLIIACMFSSVCFADENAQNTWIKSDDGIIEVKLTSVDTSNYPKIRVNCDYRLDGTKLDTDDWRVTFDLTEDLNSYISKNPSYANRKVPVSAEFGSFKLISGTVYKIELIFTIDADKKVTRYVNTDMATVFPDDFVNYEAHALASAIKETAAKLNLSDYSLYNDHCNAVKSKKYDSVTYYWFKFDKKKDTYYTVIMYNTSYAVCLLPNSAETLLMDYLKNKLGNYIVIPNSTVLYKCNGGSGTYYDAMSEIYDLSGTKDAYILNMSHYLK